MRYRFALGLLLGAAIALLTLYHVRPVEVAVLHGSLQVSSGLVHLLLILFAAVIGWILRDAFGTARDAADRHASRTTE